MQRSYWRRQRLTQDKNSRIKALEVHLAESRNEISRLTRQLDYVTEESESLQEELRHAYELRREPSSTERAPTAPPSSRTGSPVHRPTREPKIEGMVLKHSPAPSEERYITTEPKESAAASRSSVHGLDLKDLDKLARNIGKFNPSLPNSQNVHAYLQDIDFHLEMRPNVTDKDNYTYYERHPVLKCAASLTGSLLTQRLTINGFKRPSLKSLLTLSPIKA